MSSTPSLSISGRMLVKTLKTQFKEEFGLSLRVYDGRSFADDDATLASIRRSDNKGGDFAPKRNTKVGNLEDKLQELFGIKVQVTGSDDSYFCDNDHTLAQAQKHDEQLMEKRSRRQEKASKLVDATDSDAPLTDKVILIAKASKGDSEAQCNLAILYLEEQDYEEAVQWLQKAAEQDHADAQNRLAVRYMTGQGVEQDPEQASYWLTKAAELGHLKAQLNLATGYLRDPHNREKAAYWFEKAAEQGDGGAQQNLGAMYSDGVGVTQDLEKAFYWFEKAAEQGLVNAQYNLAAMYDAGEDVEKDLTKAAYWFEQAAEQGFVEAQYNLAVMYREGEGVEKDYQKAAYWHTKAAAQGFPSALHHLGDFYYYGLGVPQNWKVAYVLFGLASQNSYNDINQMQEKILSKNALSEAELEKANSQIEKLQDSGDPADICEFLENSKHTTNNKQTESGSMQLKTKEELKELLNKLIEERGNEGDFNDIDTSLIADMSHLFEEMDKFNGNISNWDTSNVTDMSYMFYKAELFNQPLNFDTSKVTNMRAMFTDAYAFNQPLNFDTSKVNDMGWFLARAVSFNHPINFDTSKVTNMERMFERVRLFNYPLNFDTSNVTDMSNMFYDAESFNQSIEGWDVSNLESFEDIFYNSAIKNNPPKWYKAKTNIFSKIIGLFKKKQQPKNTWL